MSLPDTSPHEQQVSLRPALPRDASLLNRWRGEPSIRQYQPLGAASLPQLRSELERQQVGDLYRGRGGKFQWIVRCEEQPVGWITLVVNNWDHGLAEIGYALTTGFQRRGLMSQALNALLADVFLRTKLERIEARCAVENTPSQRVLERVGFRCEGRLRGYFLLRGQRVDNHLFAILRRDFLPAIEGSEELE